MIRTHSHSQVRTRTRLGGSGLVLALLLGAPHAVAAQAASAAPGARSARTTASAAQTAKPLPVDAVLKSYTFGEYQPVQISPDGKRIAYTVRQTSGGDAGGGFNRDQLSKTGVPWSALGANIWVTDLATGQAQNITGNRGNNWGPSWSPDGRYLAYGSDRTADGKTGIARLWVWDSTTKQERLVADLNLRGRDLLWGAKSDRLLVGVLPEGITPEAYAARSAASPTAEDPKEPGSTVRLYRSAKRDDATAPTVQGGWDLDRSPMDLAWIDVATGRATRVVRNTPVSDVRLAPDGTRFCYSTAKSWEKAGSQQILFDLVVVDGAKTQIVAPGVRLSYDGAQFSWAPNGQAIAYRTTGMLANGDVFVATLDGKEPRSITPAPHAAFDKDASVMPLWDSASANVYFVDDESLWRAPVAASGGMAKVATIADEKLSILPQANGALWSPDANTSTIVVTRNKKHGGSGLRRIALASGAVTDVLVEEKYYGGYDVTDGFSVSPDGQTLSYLAQDAQHAPDLYLLESAGGAKPSSRKLTTINPQLDGYVMGERRVIEWRSTDGVPIRGVLLLPAGYETGRRYPMITKVYGGSMPSQRSANRFGLQGPPVDNLQIYATRGYAVLLPDLPVREGTVMADLVKMVVPGVDKVVEMGIADPDGLGLTGHSFGGYNTIAIITQTTRFKAAMMSGGLANMFSAYGEMRPDGTAYGLAVIEHGQFLVQGTPWERRERYMDNSPIFHLDQVRTPLLITHGAEDSAVSVFLAEEIFVGLRRLGREVAYARYEGEEHHQAQWRYANQVDYWNRTLAWFDAHLKKAEASTK